MKVFCILLKIRTFNKSTIPNVLYLGSNLGFYELINPREFFLNKLGRPFLKNIFSSLQCTFEDFFCQSFTISY